MSDYERSCVVASRIRRGPGKIVHLAGSAADCRGVSAPVDSPVARDSPQAFRIGMINIIWQAVRELSERQAAWRLAVRG
jgi:hypothetical protein